MNGVLITISARVNDGQGDTCREDVDVYVNSAGHVSAVNSETISPFDLKRNRESIATAKWQARRNGIEENLLYIRSGFVNMTPVAKVHIERRLTGCLASIKKGLAKIRNMGKVTV